MLGRLTHISLASFLWDHMQGVTLQNAASHLGLFCLLTQISSKNEIEMKKKTHTPDSPKNESGLIQMIRMGKSIRHKWVNRLAKRKRVSIVRRSLDSYQRIIDYCHL